MKNFKILNKKIVFLIVASIMLTNIFLPISANAISKEQKSLFKQDINYYDINDCIPTSSSGSNSTNDSIYIMGDSILEGATAQVTEKVKSKGYTDIKINASNSRSIEGKGKTGEKNSGLDAIKKDADFIKDASTVIVELGTNGGDTKDNINKLMKEITKINKDTQIYWVNVGVTASSLKTRMNDANKALSEQSSKDNFKIIDWSKVIGTNDPDGLLSSDGTHPNEKGNKVFGNLIATSAGEASQSSSASQTGDNSSSWESRIKAAEKYAKKQGYDMSFAVADAKTGKIIGGYNQDHKGKIASMIKAFTLGAYLDKNKNSSNIDKNNLEKMIKESSGDAYINIKNTVGNNALNDFIKNNLKVSDFNLSEQTGVTQVSSKQMATGFAHLENALPKKYHDYGMGLLSSISKEHQWGMIPAAEAAGWKWYVKAGWLSGNVHQTGIFTKGDEKVAISVIQTGINTPDKGSDGDPDSKQGHKNIEEITAILLGGSVPAVKANTNCVCTESGNSSVTPITTGKNDENAAKVWAFLTSPDGLGLTAVQAAGVMGNIQQESGFNPRLVQGPESSGDLKIDGLTGYGLMQWTTESRQKGLQEMAKKMNKNPGDFEVQFAYIKKELNEGYKSTYEKLKNSKDVVDATVVFHDGYERSADTPEYVRNIRGGKFARKWLAKFGNSTGGYTDSGGSCNKATNTPVVSGDRKEMEDKLFALRNVSFDAGPRSDIKNGGACSGGKSVRVTDGLVNILLNVGLNSGAKNIHIGTMMTGHSYKTASGNVSNHCYGKAADISGYVGKNMCKIYDYLYDNRKQLKIDELIFSDGSNAPCNGHNLKHGKNLNYNSVILGMHDNHIHVSSEE